MNKVDEQPVENTDTHLFYEDEKDVGYSDSCHMTEGRQLGIQVGGLVVSMPLREWMEMYKDVTTFDVY